MLQPQSTCRTHKLCHIIINTQLLTNTTTTIIMVHIIQGQCITVPQCTTGHTMDIHPIMESRKVATGIRPQARALTAIKSTDQFRPTTTRATNSSNGRWYCGSRSLTMWTRPICAPIRATTAPRLPHRRAGVRIRSSRRVIELSQPPRHFFWSSNLALLVKLH